MKKLELTKDELEKLYHLPPKDVEKETEFQITYRMGRNSLVLELIKKIDEELTPYIEYHDNGNVRVKGQRNSKGQREGIEEWFYPNGNIKCRIPFKGGKRDGIEERFDKQGNITGTCLWKNGEVIEETKPKLTPHIKYYLNWNVKVKGQENSVGEREGIWEWFYSNGNIERRIPYKDGKIDGIDEWFNKNGNIHMRIPFKEGKEDGIQEEFNEQGNIVKTTLWKEGELIETTEPELTPHIMYHNNGNVWIKGQKNSKGQQEGIWEYFYPKGNIEGRTPYKEGKIDGIDEWFNKNGNIQSRTSYKEGNKDGIEECFDEQGNITKTLLWKNGELIEETKPKPQPDPQLIDSMAMRYRHDFGFLDEKHKESIRTTMKQLWEEVVGLGFYKPKSK
jgi:antitoxin component YwqK of YwqJK toxin-antitoxin module